MKPVYDAVVVLREFEGRDGKKKIFQKVGTVVETEYGLSLCLDVLPVKFNGWINFYPVKTEDKAKKEPTIPEDGDPF